MRDIHIRTILIATLSVVGIIAILVYLLANTVYFSEFKVLIEAPQTSNVFPTIKRIKDDTQESLRGTQYVRGSKIATASFAIWDPQTGLIDYATNPRKLVPLRGNGGENGYLFAQAKTNEYDVTVTDISNTMDKYGRYWELSDSLLPYTMNMSTTDGTTPELDGIYRSQGTTYLVVLYSKPLERSRRYKIFSFSKDREERIYSLNLGDISPAAWRILGVINDNLVVEEDNHTSGVASSMTPNGLMLYNLGTRETQLLTTNMHYVGATTLHDKDGEQLIVISDNTFHGDDVLDVQGGISQPTLRAEMFDAKGARIDDVKTPFPPFTKLPKSDLPEVVVNQFSRGGTFIDNLVLGGLRHSNSVYASYEYDYVKHAFTGFTVLTNVSGPKGLLYTGLRRPIYIKERGRYMQPLLHNVHYTSQSD